MEYKYEPETLDWAKKLFPMAYDLLKAIEENNPEACEYVELNHVEPTINIADILVAFEEGDWGLRKLKADCQRRYDIMSLLARMEDEMGINPIEIE